MSRRPVSTAVFEGLSLVSFTLFLIQTEAGIIGTKGLRRVATLHTATSNFRIAVLMTTFPGFPAARSRS